MNRILTITAALLMLAAPLIAQPAGRHHRGEAFSPRIAQRLHLTSEQTDQLREMHRTFRQENRQFFESWRQDFHAFRDAKRNGDTAKMDELKSRIDAEREQFKQLRQALDQRIATVLTPEQVEEWRQMRAERKGRR